MDMLYMLVFIGLCATALWLLDKQPRIQRRKQAEELLNARGRLATIPQPERLKRQSAILDFSYFHRNATVDEISQHVNENIHDIRCLVDNLIEGELVEIVRYESTDGLPRWRAGVVRAGDRVKLTPAAIARLSTGGEEMRVKVGDNSPTAINSVLISSQNSVIGRIGGEHVEALEQLRRLVEASNNPNAQELYDSFLEELQKTPPRRSTLATLFNGIKAATPALTEMAELADKIVRIFS
jgi:hypothetical protein